MSKYKQRNYRNIQDHLVYFSLAVLQQLKIRKQYKKLNFVFNITLTFSYKCNAIEYSGCA